MQQITGNQLANAATPLPSTVRVFGDRFRHAGTPIDSIFHKESRYAFGFKFRPHIDP